MVFDVVRVKWGREKFEGVEVNTDESPEVFKMQLFSLSGLLNYKKYWYYTLFILR